MPRIALIDNYDSFTFNVLHAIGALGARVEVHRNDKITVGEIEAMRPDRIVISPGPGRPENAGISVDVLRTFGPSIPTLGVCLGHQAMGYAFGGRVVSAPVLMHGKTSDVEHDGKGVFKDIAQGFTAAR